MEQEIRSSAFFVSSFARLAVRGTRSVDKNTLTAKCAKFSQRTQRGAGYGISESAIESAVPRLGDGNHSDLYPLTQVFAVLSKLKCPLFEASEMSG